MIADEMEIEELKLQLPIDCLERINLQQFYLQKLYQSQNFDLDKINIEDMLTNNYFVKKARELYY